MSESLHNKCPIAFGLDAFVLFQSHNSVRLFLFCTFRSSFNSAPIDQQRPSGSSKYLSLSSRKIFVNPPQHCPRFLSSVLLFFSKWLPLQCLSSPHHLPLMCNALYQLHELHCNCGLCSHGRCHWHSPQCQFGRFDVHKPSHLPRL